MTNLARAMDEEHRRYLIGRLNTIDKTLAGGTEDELAEMMAAFEDAEEAAHDNVVVDEQDGETIECAARVFLFERAFMLGVKWARDRRAAR